MWGAGVILWVVALFCLSFFCCCSRDPQALQAEQDMQTAQVWGGGGGGGGEGRAGHAG